MDSVWHELAYDDSFGEPLEREERQAMSRLHRLRVDVRPPLPGEMLGPCVSRSLIGHANRATGVVDDRCRLGLWRWVLDRPQEESERIATEAHALFRAARDEVGRAALATRPDPQLQSLLDQLAPFTDDELRHLVEAGLPDTPPGSEVVRNVKYVAQERADRYDIAYLDRVREALPAAIEAREVGRGVAHETAVWALRQGRE